jgi:hypothetical protein
LEPAVAARLSRLALASWQPNRSSAQLLTRALGGFDASRHGRNPHSVWSKPFIGWCIQRLGKPKGFWETAAMT